VLWRLTLALAAQRERVRGKPEPRARADFSFYVERANGDERVRIVQRRRDAPLDRIVAEMMILANSEWALMLADHGVPAVYRSQQAGRVKTGTHPLPHQGLGVPQYMWTTSPLRRYADLVNQRQLLAVLAGSLAPGGGQVRLDGQPLGQWPALALARRRAVLVQQAVLQFPFLVAEVVALGRSPHHGRSGVADDERIVGEAMRLVGIEDLAERDYLALSGGERQRVHIARGLAQVWEAPADGARWFLLDEPTASLDLRHQIGLMKTLRRLAREGWGVVAVLHDLHLVVRWADRCLLVSEGRLVADGAPAAVLTPERIGEVYELEPEDRPAFAVGAAGIQGRGR